MRVRGNWKAPVWISKRLVISLMGREAQGRTRGGACHGKQESVDNEISFRHVWFETTVECPTGAEQQTVGNICGQLRLG